MARYKRFVFVICSLIILSVFYAILPIRSNAANSTQEADSVLSYFDAPIMKTGSPYTGSGQIESVTVSNDGYFLLVFDEGNTVHHIELYSDKCDILYHLVIKEAGAIAATFDNESSSALLFLLREKIVLRIDPTGNCVHEDAREFNLNTIDDNNTSFDKTVGDKTYKYINNLFNKTLTVALSDGTILFQRKATSNILRWLIISGSLVVILCSVYFWKCSYTPSKAKRFK